MAHAYKDAKESFVGILAVVHIVFIDEDGHLSASYFVLSRVKAGPRAAREVSDGI